MTQLFPHPNFTTRTSKMERLQGSHHYQLCPRGGSLIVSVNKHVPLDCLGCQ